MAEENKNSKPEAKGEDTPPGEKHARRPRSTPRPGSGYVTSEPRNLSDNDRIVYEALGNYIDVTFKGLNRVAATRRSTLWNLFNSGGKKGEIARLAWCINDARSQGNSDEEANLVKEFYDKYIGNAEHNPSGNTRQRPPRSDEEGWNL